MFVITFWLCDQKSPRFPQKDVLSVIYNPDGGTWKLVNAKYPPQFA
jgi:hypothetical protein